MPLQITFNFALDDEGGNPEDPAVIDLTADPAQSFPFPPTWGVRRVSNGAVVIGAGDMTPIVHDSTGRYHVTLVDGVGGITLIAGEDYEISWRYFDVDAPGVAMFVQEVVTAGGDASPSLNADVLLPLYRTRDLPPIAQGSQHAIQWTITDANGDPVDLSAKTVRLVGFAVEDDQYTDSTLDDVPTGAFQYETDGGGIAVGGVDSNVVTLTHDAVKTALAGDYRYLLWNVTDLVVLVKGRMPIEPAVVEV